MIFSKQKSASGCHNSPTNEKATRVNPTGILMKIAAFLLPCIALTLLSSCASVSVKEEKRVSRQPAHKPSQIYVANFGTQRGTYKAAGDSGKDIEAFKKKTSE